MATISGTWTKLASNDSLQRSSHSLASDSDNVYLFGGELAPRQPKDNDLFKLSLSSRDLADINATDISSEKPLPRVGASLTELHGKLYRFSGRGGVEMRPVDEKGAVQVFDIAKSTWELVTPADPAARIPEARSYHCATTDKQQRIFTHAGCPETGRLQDLWSFDVNARTWTQHADAPGPPRGGTSIAFADGKLWRMNGFDGKHEIGGSLDVFDPENNTWTTIEYAADGKAGPGARSVSALLAITIESRPHLVTMFGEADPSSLGHAGAGKMLSDSWAYDIHGARWKRIVSDNYQVPQPRGWFDATTLSSNKILLTGGLADSNERLSDAWLLTLV